MRRKNTFGPYIFIRSTCLYSFIQMNLSIAFQSLQTPELNGRHTIVCDLKHFIKEQTLRNVSKGKYFTLKKVTKNLNFHFFIKFVSKENEDLSPGNQAKKFKYLMGKLFAIHMWRGRCFLLVFRFLVQMHGV